MKHSLVLASLVAVTALAACGKKEEVAPVPAPAPVESPAAVPTTPAPMAPATDATPATGGAMGGATGTTGGMGSTGTGTDPMSATGASAVNPGTTPPMGNATEANDSAKKAADAAAEAAKK